MPRIQPLLVLCCVAFACLAQPQSPHAITIVHVNVVDVVAGDIRPDQTVLIANGRITALGPANTINVPAGSTPISGQGKYLSPGLWDMHVHLRSNHDNPVVPLVRENESMLDLFLPNGVVGIREMGGDLSDHVIQWRDEIRAGRREGPRILTAGRKLDNDPPEWPGSIGVAGPEEARQAVRQVKEAGADFVKVYFRDVKPEVFQAVIEEAHRQHLKVTGHKPFEMSLQEFIETGVDGLEHCLYLPAMPREQYDALVREYLSRRGKPWAADAREIAGRAIVLEDAKEEDRVYHLMAGRQIWLTPTLEISSRVQNELRDYESDKRKLYFFPALWVFRKVQPPPPALIQEVAKRREQATLAAFKAGVPMILGTDCGANNMYMVPGWSVHEELQALVRIGLTPAEALRMATLNAAKWRGATDEGSVDVGKVADLVLLRSDPLSDIRHTQEVDSVLQGGRHYSRSDLDAMLKRAQERATQATQTSGAVCCSQANALP